MDKKYLNIDKTSTTLGFANIVSEAYSQNEILIPCYLNVRNIIYSRASDLRSIAHSDIHFL